MTKHQITIANFTIEAHPQLTLEELCMACDITPEYINDLIEYGVLELESAILETHYFDSTDLRRVRTTVHLQRDLEINLPGAALAVELMEEMESMRARIAMLEKYISTSTK